MEKLHAPVQHRPRRPHRSSIAHISILRRIAFAGVLLGGLCELAADKQPSPDHAPARVQAGSIDTVLYDCRAALGTLDLEERFAPPDEEFPPDPGIAPWSMTRVAAGKVWSTCKKLCTSPSDTAVEIKDDIRASVRYVRDYRMTEEEVDRSEPTALDCNDHANITCQKLERLGYPMYLLSIWPEDPALRFDQGWHQMSACKLRENCFLIFDDQKQTLWHGSLASFARKYGSKVTMRIIPRFGISAFAEPKYNNPVSKFLVQAKHGIPGEEIMQSLDLPQPKQNFPLLAGNEQDADPHILTKDRTRL